MACSVRAGSGYAHLTGGSSANTTHTGWGLESAKGMDTLHRALIPTLLTSESQNSRPA